MSEIKQQDELWDLLSEEKRIEYRNNYKNDLKLITEGPSGYNLSKAEGRFETLVSLFGEHNLNPKSQIKTWEDVSFRDNKLDVSEGDNYYNISLSRTEFPKKLFLKIIASARIAKLIDLGYGGMVSEEEWKDDSMEKFVIKPYYQRGKCFLERSTSYNYKWFIAFHTLEQREEFMSHESNRKLVEVYYMM